jgi:hypothetical protein
MGVWFFDMISRVVAVFRGSPKNARIQSFPVSPISLRLTDLKDVSIGSVANHQILTYDEASSRWQNDTILSSVQLGSYASVPFSGQTSVNVIHGFGTYPLVQVINGSGGLISPQSITHDSENEFTVVFEGSTSGTILASLGSPHLQNIKTKTTDYTLVNGDTVVLGNDAITLTLPTAVGIEGKWFTIKNIHAAENVTIDTTSGQTIDGEASFLLGTNAALTVVSDGANWVIL